MYSTNIEGRATTFGTSGLLYRSNKIMYDRATNTLWSQLLGEAVIGPLAESGVKLRVFPTALTTWAEWLAEHPDTTVLALETGGAPPSLYRPESDPVSAYFGYRRSDETRFPVSNRDSRLDTKDEVLVMSIGNNHKAYPLESLQRERVVNDQLGGTGVVVIASSASTDARVYHRHERVFSLSDGGTSLGGLPMSLVDSDGAEWRVTDDALVNATDPSETLARVPSHVSFWFAWFAFHPDTLVYGVDDGG